MGVKKLKNKIIKINQQKIDSIVKQIPVGSFITFSDIAMQVFGNRCGGIIGGYIYSQRTRTDYPWWRVVNVGCHPVVDLVAITNLMSEGHKIKNGKLI